MSKVPDANGYQVLYAISPAPENDLEWYSKLFSSTKGKISGLKSGSKYIFKVAATSAFADKINSYNFSKCVERYIQ